MSQLPSHRTSLSLALKARRTRSISGESTPSGGSFKPSIGATVSPSIHAKYTSSAATSVTGSTAITAIDVDVAVREVASPDARLAPLAQSEIDGDLNFSALDRLRRRGFVVLGSTFALFRDNMIAEGNSEFVAIGGFARFAHRHDDTAPVGILACDCGFHQRRIGDRERDALGCLVALGAGHI